MASYLGRPDERRAIAPIFTGGLSAGRSVTKTPGQSGSVGGYMRLQSNAPRSTASPATRRRSTAPEDIYKVFPGDTGRADVPFQQRFRTMPEDAQTGGYTRLSEGLRREEETAPVAQPRSETRPIQMGPKEQKQTPIIKPLEQEPGRTPEATAGAVTLPEKPSYLDRPELPDYTEQFRDYEAQTREVQPEETMQGQMQRIMEEGNPLMDLARSRADQEAASRGLFHSMGGVVAAERAMLDAIMPIASQDAATYANQARINQEFLQNASNMTTETFNTEIAQRANQGRQMQLMSYESDIRERLAGVDQRYAMQLETLSQEYKILGEQYRQAGTLYADALRSMATLLGNNQLTAEQQAAGVESLVGQLEAGLQFMTGVSGGTTGVSTQTPARDVMGLSVGSGVSEAAVPGISTEQTMGVYPGNEIDAEGQFEAARLRVPDPEGGMKRAQAPRHEVLRIDQGSGLPSLIKVGNWYYRPRGWNERNGLASSQLLVGPDNTQYLEFMAMKEPEQERLQQRSDEYYRQNPGGGRLGGGRIGREGFATAPNLYMEIPA